MFQDFSLTLQNFRCFDEKTFHLKQFTLLDGPSGSGKTSVLKAVSFLFSGKERQCVSFGKHRCSVSADFSVDGTRYSIVRTCGPRRLVVESREGIFEHATAQDHLDRRLGADRFYLGHVAQNSTLFLSMTPGDRYKLARSVLMDEERLDKIKTAMTTLRRRRQQRYDFLKGKISAYGSLVSGRTVGSNKETPEETVEKLKETTVALRRALLSAESDNKMRSEVTRRLNELPSGDPSLPRVEMDRIEGALPFISEWRKRGRPDLETLRDVPEARRVKEYLLLTGRLAELEKITAMRGEVHRCPACLKDLVLRNGILAIKTGKVIGPENEEDAASVRDLRRKLDSMRHPDDFNLVERVPSSLYALYELFPEEGVSEDLLNTSPEELERRVKDLTEEMEKRTERERLSCVRLPDYRPTADMHKELSALEDRLRLAESEERIKTVALKRGATIEAELASEALSRSAALLVLAAEAENVYLRSGLSVMFAFVDHLMALMTEGGIRVSFLLEPNAIKVIVTNRGKETDQSTLSGGESARLNIAMAVTMAILNELPFILLDEATSSLDQETSSLVLNIVRSVYDGIVVCVAHQAVVGEFDHVIPFEKITV